MVAPASTGSEASVVVSKPLFSYMLSKLSFSSCGKDSGTFSSPFSSTSTSRPALLRFAAMTPPPAPEPTMTTSTSRVVSSESWIMFGAKSWPFQAAGSWASAVG